MAEPLFLIVDDEPLFVRSVLDTVGSTGLGLRSLGVSNGAEALDLIDKEDVTVLLTDLHMPVMDGYQLLAELVSRDFQAPIIVATAFGNPELELRLRTLDGMDYLEKPADLDHLLELLEEMVARGRTNGVSLKDFVQILAAAGKSSAAEVRSGKNRGRMVFKRRGLMHARAGQLTGNKALQEILSWPHPELKLQSGRAQETIPIHNVASQLAQETDFFSAGPGELPADDNQAERKPTEIDRDNNSTERKTPMNVKEAITTAMSIDGAVGAALVNHESGMTLGSEGAAIDIELAASGNTEVVRSKLAVMRSLGLKDEIEDILITLDTQFHLIRPLKRARDLFLYLAIERTKGNLGLARHQLSKIEDELDL